MKKAVRITGICFIVLILLIAFWYFIIPRANHYRYWMGMEEMISVLQDDYVYPSYVPEHMQPYKSTMSFYSTSSPFYDRDNKDLILGYSVYSAVETEYKEETVMKYLFIIKGNTDLIKHKTEKYDKL